ncbi:hypothetical protein OS493_019367 [Desmophyllum pertusum]|uniref:Chromo domain-containing protein n=1 Tax=Desmophyllum pertusum TaxID=174260 RepID=A0A9X0A0I9_9CNID|nr:hypothetical protein OS493_019367 [Desmophyllum pertusum]
MAAQNKRSRPRKDFLRPWKTGVGVKAERIQTKTEKVDTETMYPIEITERDKGSNKVKIHFIGYANEYDEWRDTDQLGAPRILFLVVACYDFPQAINLWKTCHVLSSC